MTKMGFYPQTANFRTYHFCPSYFLFCRCGSARFGCPSSSCSIALLRLKHRGSTCSDRPHHVNLLQLKQRSNYCTYQHGHGQMNPQRNNFTYSQMNNPFARKEMEWRKDDTIEVWNDLESLGHTAEDWGRVTEEFKQSKIVHRRNVSAHAKTLPRGDIAGKYEPIRRDTCENEVKGYIGERGPVCIARVQSNVALHKPGGGGKPAVESHPVRIVPSPNGFAHKINALDTTEGDEKNKKHAPDDCVSEADETIASSRYTEVHERLSKVYNKVLLVDSIPVAREVVEMLTNNPYKGFIHACDTEVANIDVKEETPVNHGEIICFSIYSGPKADFGNGRSCIWVDVLDGGGKELLQVFAPFFEDSSIRKVWHNYSFDSHVLENYGLKPSGFYADTMHMARLWNSARRTEGGYSLEALTGDSKIMSDAKMGDGEEVVGKVSMKELFGRKKLKKDGSEGKLITIPPVEELQRAERRLWICYSSLDSISTLKLYESLEKKLKKTPWSIEGCYKGSMFDNYQIYLRPFGELLVKMESEGMLVDRSYLAEIEKVAKGEQQVAVDRFRKWASKHCPDAKYMNVGSDTQLRQIFFGGIQNRKDQNEYLPVEKEFKVPNVDNIIEEGRKSPSKYYTIKLRKPEGVNIETDKYTASGWPSMGGDALKTLAGKVSAEFEFFDANEEEVLDENKALSSNVDIDTSAYGTAYSAFSGGQAGIEACHAIAALCEVCSIDSLISNFILPLQGNHISGKNRRIHCSLNINTETGRLSARRPNLQNQPALEKDRYKIRQAFIAAPGNSLIVADYGQLELRILAHLANCQSMLDAFKAGGDFHSRTAMNMYPHIREAVQSSQVLLEWHPQPGEDKPPVPLLKDAFASERRKAKMLNFSIAYGKTTVGLARDWKVSREEAQETVNLWYSDRKEVLSWQEERKRQAHKEGLVYTLLGRARHFPSLRNAGRAHKNHIERAAINTPVQGSAADVAMCAMLQISKNTRLQELGWKLILQVHDEVILEGPTESAEEAKAIVVDCMSKPFDGENFLRVGLSVDAKCAQTWYAAK